MSVKPLISFLKKDLDHSPLSGMSFATIFSQSVVCLLIFLTFSIIEQKFLILMKPSLLIISFMNRTFIL